MNSNFEELRSQFPAIQQKIRGKPVIYFDSACTTIPPMQVINAVSDYYSRFPSCHGRTMHSFGKELTDKYDEARRKIQTFINAKHSDEIIFLRNATEGINLVAQSFQLKEGDTILCSDMEHNSNLLPWQRLVTDRRVNHRRFKMNPDSTFNMETFASEIDHSVKLVSVMHASNVTGVILPVKDICRIAHSQGACVLVDATQSAPSLLVDVQEMDADFLVFSMHKSYGPSGMGILYGKRGALHRLSPLLLGGESVDDTTYESYTLSPVPERFEAGLQNYAGVIGSAAAVNFLMNIDKQDISQHKLKLNKLATDGLTRFSEVRIIGPKDPAERGGIVNFIIETKRSYDLALLLDQASNIMVRPGRHCVHSWYNANGLADSVRVSFGLYNTEDEVLKFLEVLRRVIRWF